MDVINAEELVSRFGEWPSFHDAEVLGVRMDSGQRSDGTVRVELDIHVFVADGLLPSGQMNFVDHSLVTLEFEEVEAIELDGFGPQNVLFDLRLTDVHLAAGRQIQVELPSSNGMTGAFRCRTITVLGVRNHDPGPHSVYGS